jgi:hypothetical protein
VRVGKLNLVDLAGSERQSKTGATGASEGLLLLLASILLTCTLKQGDCVMYTAGTWRGMAARAANPEFRSLASCRA